MPSSYSQQLYQPTLPVQSQQLQLSKLQQAQRSVLHPTLPVVQHSATGLQPLGVLQQLTTQQYATTAQHLLVPVPVELQQEIILVEYIDLALLLHKSSFVEAPQAQYTTQHYKHKPPAISSFSM